MYFLVAINIIRTTQWIFNLLFGGEGGGVRLSTAGDQSGVSFLFRTSSPVWKNMKKLIKKGKWETEVENKFGDLKRSEIDILRGSRQNVEGFFFFFSYSLGILKEYLLVTYFI